MIAYLQGRVRENVVGRIIIIVGDQTSTGAVGYAVNVPHNQQYLNLTSGQWAELYIHTHVREDCFELFGFLTSNEKQIFLNLLSVSGIGPKLALALLGAVHTDQFIDILLRSDAEALTKIPGIGKKTAERIVLELSEKIQKKIKSGSMSVSKRMISTQAFCASHEETLASEAKEALRVLGYKDFQINHMLNEISKRVDPPQKVEDLLRLVLQKPL